MGCALLHEYSRKKLSQKVTISRNSQRFTHESFWLYGIQANGTHDCASILDFLVATIFCIVHPYIPIHSVAGVLHLYNYIYIRTCTCTCLLISICPFVVGKADSGASHDESLHIRSPIRVSPDRREPRVLKRSPHHSDQGTNGSRLPAKERLYVSKNTIGKGNDHCLKYIHVLGYTHVHIWAYFSTFISREEVAYKSS